jgi:hypothetical protein
MDVYGLIYERGLIGALKYANTIEVSNPSLATNIDLTVERLIVLSGIRAEKSFIKIAQGPETSGSNEQQVSYDQQIAGEQPLSDDPQINNSLNSLTETQKYQLTEEVKQLQNQTNSISQQQIAELNRREQLSLDQRRKLATSVNENALEQAFNVLSAAGKIPVISTLTSAGVGIQKVLNISALCSSLFKYKNILKRMPELLKQYENRLITADEIVKELKQLPTNSKAFSESIKRIQSTFNNLTKNSMTAKDVRTKKLLDLQRVELMTKTHDAFLQPGQVVAQYENILSKSFPAYDPKAMKIVRECRGKTYDEIFAILEKADKEAKLLNSKATNAAKLIKDNYLDDFTKALSKDLKPDFLHPLTKVSPLKGKGKEIFDTEYFGVIEKILGKNKFTKNFAPEFIGNLTKGIGGILNVGSVLFDLKNLYDEYKKNGITAQLICNGLAALANIASFVPPLWPYATAINLALSVGCMFLGSMGVDTKSEVGKPADRESEIDLLYKAFLGVGQSPKAAETPQEQQAARELFMQETNDASFDSIATVDQALLKQIFNSKDNRNIPNIQHAFQQNIQNLNTPFKTFRVYLKELDNIKTLAQDPNAKVQFIVPTSKKISPEQQDQTAKSPNTGEAALGF